MIWIRNSYLLWDQGKNWLHDNQRFPETLKANKSNGIKFKPRFSSIDEPWESSIGGLFDINNFFSSLRVIIHPD